MKTEIARIQCDCMAESLVFNRYDWHILDTDYEFSFENSYIGKTEYQGLWGRIKLAWKALTNKPVSYMDITISNRDQIEKFLKECLQGVELRTHDNTFVEEIRSQKIPNNPLDILDWYRNLYHCEDNHTERGIMANAINDLFVKYKKELGL